MMGAFPYRSHSHHGLTLPCFASMLSFSLRNANAKASRVISTFEEVVALVVHQNHWLEPHANTNVLLNITLIFLARSFQNSFHLATVHFPDIHKRNNVCDFQTRPRTQQRAALINSHNPRHRTTHDIAKECAHILINRRWQSFDAQVVRIACITKRNVHGHCKMASDAPRT